MKRPISFSACCGILVLATMIAFGGCSSTVPAPPNVVLISVDTLRSDHLGCYEYTRATSPEIDKVARQGTLFEQAVANAPWTLPSHGSMLTGLFPKSHTLKTFRSRLPEDAPTLATLLSAAGYETLGLVNAPAMDSTYGFGRGFDDYILDPAIGPDGQLRSAKKQIGRAIEWLDSREDRPFFLFLHNFDVHGDYNPSDEFLKQFASPYDGPFRGTTEELQQVYQGKLEMGEDDLRHVIDRYDAGIRELDHDLKRLLEHLRDLPDGGDTIVVITSDHGEEFMEHGRTLHGTTMYEEMLSVPLIFSGPGVPAGKRVQGLVQLTDIVPTLLDLVGISIPEEIEGRSLVPVWSGAADELEGRFVFAEADHEHGQVDIKRMVRQGDIKLIHDREIQRSLLFDLDRDPAERDDLSDRQPAMLGPLVDALDEYWAGALEIEPRLPPLRERRRKRLKSLGYLQ